MPNDYLLKISPNDIASLVSILELFKEAIEINVAITAEDRIAMIDHYLKKEPRNITDKDLLLHSDEQVLKENEKEYVFACILLDYINGIKSKNK